MCNYASITHAVTPCDHLAALEADPLHSKSVDFSDLNKTGNRMYRSD